MVLKLPINIADYLFGRNGQGGNSGNGGVSSTPTPQPIPEIYDKSKKPSTPPQDGYEWYWVMTLPKIQSDGTVYNGVWQQRPLSNVALGDIKYKGSGEEVEQSVYSGSSVLGKSVQADNERGISEIGRLWGGSIQSGRLRINKWLGIYTRAIRNMMPIGALESVQNFNFTNKIGGMSLRSGIASYATSYTDLGGTVLTALHKIFCLATESPTASNIDIVCGTDASANKHVFQKPFFKDSTTAINSYVKWGEKLSGITIKDWDSSLLRFDGGSTVENYYKGWVIHNTTQNLYSYVYGSSYLAGVTSLDLAEQLSWNVSDALVLYRFFHDTPSFSDDVTYSSVVDRKPIALQQGNAVLFSGGMGTSIGLKPVWSGYIDKTFFNMAENKNAGTRYQGTYVEQAEILGNGITVTVASSVESSSSPLSAGRWFYCVVPETDDGIKGNPIWASTKYFDADGTNSGTFQIRINFGRLNKRLKNLNVFMGKTPNDTDATIDWHFLFFVGQYSLLGTATESDWSWTHIGGDTSNYYYQLYSPATLNNATWNNQSRKSDSSSESLVDHVGHVECTSTTVSFSKGIFVNNRLFVAKYYDYVEGIEYLDQIRYSDFSWDGRAQLNVLCNLPEFTQTTIEQGDASSVQALSRYQDKLLILKDSSCYTIPISDDPTLWQLITISTVIGCTAPESVVETPYMTCWVQPNEDIYGWKGGEPESLAMNWLDTFKSLVSTYKNNWIGWYNAINKSYNIGIGLTGANFNKWYEMSFENQIPNGYLWSSGFIGKTNGNNVLSVVDITTRKSDNKVYLVVYNSGDSSFTIGYFDQTAKTDLGHGIEPYFKTAQLVIDEIEITKLKKLYISCEPTGGSGVLDMQLSIDSKVNNYTNIAKTNNLISVGVLMSSNRGRLIQLSFNNNLAADGGGATYTGLTIFEINLDYEIIEFSGDKTIT